MPDISSMLERAELLLNQGRYKDAEQTIKKVLETEPENDHALSVLARCYLNNKRFDEGIAIIKDAIAIDPLNDFYFYLAGFGYYQKGVSDEAINQLKRAIRLNPYHAEYFGLLSFVYIEQKDFPLALEKADEGLALQADNITCLNARARALNKMRRTDDAIATMENALAQDPDNYVTHNTVGWNLLEKGRHKEAQKHFLEALRLYPELESARVGLKESLKSKIAPYRWLLQYSFWVSNRGKKLQVALPIILYIAFRLLIAIFSNFQGTAALGWVLAAVYLLFVVVSWSINSVANFFLLFHPLGKYALTVTERWTAITVVSALITGLILLSLASFTGIATGTAYDGGLFIAGLVCVSLALPLSEMQYPLRLKGKGWRTWAAAVLVGLGILSLAVFIAAPLFYLLFGIYGVLFILYNWSSVVR
jgi:tetratricopeptide (TPR) repeat protein